MAASIARAAQKIIRSTIRVLVRRILQTMRTLLCLTLIALTPHTAEPSCMQAQLTSQVLTRRDTRLPIDGGVLVGYTYATGNDIDRDDTWTGSVALTRVQLAPGLSVFRPAAKATSFKLTTKAGKDRGSFTLDPKSAATTMTAPNPKLLTSKTTEGFRSMTTTTTLKLNAAPPADAVAIIAYDDQHKALLYAGLPDTHDKLLEFEIDSTGGHCGTPKPVGEGALAGKITFAYVDAFGRLSPTSTAVTMR
jgi:hypothetical protein